MVGRDKPDLAIFGATQSSTMASDRRYSRFSADVPEGKYWHRNRVVESENMCMLIRVIARRGLLRSFVLASCKMMLAFPLILPTACAGGGDPCSPIPAVRVSPQNATLDHNASPGNSQRFFSFATASPGCVAPMSSLMNVSWSVSDANVSISNAKDATFGTATCLGPTSGPITVTAMLPASANHGRAVSGTASLKCK